MAEIYDFELYSDAKKVACIFSAEEIGEEIARMRTYIQNNTGELYVPFMTRKLLVYECALKLMNAPSLKKKYEK